MTTETTDTRRIESASYMTQAVGELAKGVGLKGTLAKLDYEPEPKAVAWFNTRANDISFSVPEYLRLREVAGRAIDEAEFHRLTRELPTHIKGAARTLANNPAAKFKTMNELAGFLVHEASHAHNSTWGEMVKGVSEAVVSTMVLFEESRIEKRAVDNAGKGSDMGYGYASSATAGRYPVFRIKQFLRAVTRLFLETMTEFVHPLQVIHAWALMRGRVISGTMEVAEFAPIDNAARTIFGDNLMDDLADIHDEAIGLSVKENGVERLIELAEEWNDTLGIKTTVIDHGGCGLGHESESEKGEGEGEGEGSESEDEGEGEGSGGSTEGEAEGESGEGTGESTGTESEGGIGGDGKGDGKGEPTDADADGGKGDTDEAPDYEKADDSLWDDIPDELPEKVGGISPEGFGTPPEFSQAVQQVLDETEWDKADLDMANPREQSDKVFGKKPNYKAGPWDERKPTPQEVRAAQKLAQHLESLTIPSIAKTKILTEKPTGRMKSREAVRRSAERAQGRMSTAKPWVEKKTKHGLGAPVIVGIATDTSGSMSWAEKMVASTAYIVGRAGHHINAKTAAVTFGNKVSMVVNPEELPTTVRVHEANGGTEEFDKAMAALDGVLGLTTAPGAKVLVIVSDNELVIPMEGYRRAEWMKRFKRAGVNVIWVDGSDRSVPDTTSVGISRSHASDPMHLVKVISDAVDESFAKSKR